MIKLHYAEINNDGDIPCLEFNNEKDFNSFLFKVTENIVYLFSFEFPSSDGKTEVFVTEDLTMIAVIMSNCFDSIQTENVFYLQEYPSFEDAYRVALDMQETSELCYNK
jgi:hypothetical protein